jgi:hypothetical protein
MTTRARVLLLVLGVAALAVADRVWYEAFTIKPKQKGTLRATFSYNSTNWPDLLEEPVSLSVGGYKYIFNQTNDISDNFFWKRPNKHQYNYKQIIQNVGLVKMNLNLRTQRAKVSMQQVNLLILQIPVSNRTDFFPVSLQIGPVESSEDPYFKNYQRNGTRPYSNNFFFVRTTKLKYGSATQDRFQMTGICKYNAYTSLPATVNATLTAAGEGAVSSFAGLVFNVPLARMNQNLYAYNDGTKSMTINFQTGALSFRNVGQPLPITMAQYQTNFNFMVNLQLSDAGGFSELTTYRAKTVSRNTIQY